MLPDKSILPVVQHFPKGLCQRFPRDRFGEKGFDSFGPGLLPGDTIGVSGAQNNGDVVANLHHEFRQQDAREPGHGHIRYDGVKTFPAPNERSPEPSGCPWR